MTGMKKLFSLLLIFTPLMGMGQVVSWDIEYEDWNFEKTAAKEKVIVKHPYLREADVKYSKRIHRVIDTRQKINKVLTWERNPFTKYIHEAVLKNEIKAYKSDSLFTATAYTAEEAAKLGGTETTIQIQDPMYPDDEFALIDTTIVEPFEWYNIKKIRVMEDWYFDFKHSVFKPRIIGLAPLYQPMIEGVLLPEQPLYWLYIEEIRPEMAQMELFNRSNDAARLSIDDFFQMRMFDSYIVKYSNEFDLDINKFEEFENNDLAVLLKGEEIKNDLFIIEHDLWEY
jgi:gliding motility associated protien GldN